jgi:hypothetical protein
MQNTLRKPKVRKHKVKRTYIQVQDPETRKVQHMTVYLRDFREVLGRVVQLADELNQPASAQS